MIFYEAPHRLLDTLNSIIKVLGDRDVYLARELTKKFEEHYYMKASELLTKANLKGEMVLIVKGYEEDLLEEQDRFKLIEEQIKLGLKTNAAIKEVANMLKLDKKELYKEYVAYKTQQE